MVRAVWERFEDYCLLREDGIFRNLVLVFSFRAIELIVIFGLHFQRTANRSPLTNHRLTTLLKNERSEVDLLLRRKNKLMVWQVSF